ncbi:MAG: carbon-nitrogen hydrolase family protein [Magnetococcales bacterium]|nr:carbon-nitrogen hydrolase family protein [Magnetococcales bacterium]
MSTKTLAAAIQMNSGPDRDHNLEVADRLMRDAVHRGAQLLSLPETFSFFGRTEEEKQIHREKIDGPTVTFLQSFAKQHGVWIIGGSVCLIANGDNKVTNSSLFIGDDGTIRARYDKIHLFDAVLGNREPYRESDVVHPGRDPVVVDSPFGVIGLSICYDLRFPELYRHLSAMKAVILAIPSSFTHTTGKDHWELLVRVRAVENFCFVLAPNQWGTHPGGRRTYGHSMIVEPWGTVSAQCPEGEGVALAELDLSRVVRCRDMIPCLSHRVL